MSQRPDSVTAEQEAELVKRLTTSMLIGTPAQTEYRRGVLATVETLTGDMLFVASIADQAVKAHAKRTTKRGS